MLRRVAALTVAGISAHVGATTIGLSLPALQGPIETERITREKSNANITKKSQRVVNRILQTYRGVGQPFSKFTNDCVFQDPVVEVTGPEQVSLIHGPRLTRSTHIFCCSCRSKHSSLDGR